MVTELELKSPAALVALQTKVVPAVSPFTVVPHAGVTMPDSGSLVLQLNVTPLVYHPLAPNVPVMAGAEITGGVLSIRRWRGYDALRLAPFTAVHSNEALALNCDAAHPEDDVTPDSASVTLQVTVTSPTYHPFAPWVPVIVGVMTGPVVSAGGAADGAGNHRRLNTSPEIPVAKSLIYAPVVPL
jgi:hypothetical protein